MKKTILKKICSCIPLVGVCAIPSLILTSCTENGGGSNQDITDSGYEHINFINDLSFSIKGTSRVVGTNYGYSYMGTCWIVGEVFGDQNPYDYYMVTNSHVDLPMTGTPTYSTDGELISMELIYYEGDISSDNKNSINENSKECVSLEVYRDVGYQDYDYIELVYSPFDIYDYGSTTPREADVVVDGKTIRPDIDVFKVNLQPIVKNMDVSVKNHFDHVNDILEMPDMTQYQDKNGNNIDTLDIFQFDNTKNLTKEDIAPDVNNDGKNSLYFLGWPFVEDSYVKLNYAETSFDHLDDSNPAPHYVVVASEDDPNPSPSYSTGDAINLWMGKNSASNMTGGSSGSMVINENYQVLGPYWGTFGVSNGSVYPILNILTYKDTNVNYDIIKAALVK